MTPPMPFLAIKNFEKFQHYRDRNPPWIKLYTALLDDPAFLGLHESAQAQLMKLWLLAARMGHPLPNNPRLLAGKIGATGRFQLDSLIGAGFVTPCNDVASTPASKTEEEPLAKRTRKARRSVRARDESTEGEAESEKTSAADAAAVNGKKPPAKKRETWVTPFADAWHEMYGGPMSVEPSVRPLKDAVNALGAEEALRRWEIYLAQTPGRFANAAKFAATLNEWEAPKAGGTVPAPRITVSDITMARAVTLFAIGRDHKLFKFEGNRAQYSAAKKKAAEDPRAGDAFDAEFAATRMWEGLDGIADAMAIKEIGRRLELSRQNAHTEQPVRAAS